MSKFPVVKAFIVHDLISGIPRKVFMAIWTVGLFVALGAGQIYFIVVCGMVHYICYLLTKHFDVNFIEIFIIYFTSDERLK